MTIVATLMLAYYSIEFNNPAYKIDRVDEVTVYICVWAWLMGAMMMMVKVLEFCLGLS
jgi:hypothetical protein